MKSVKIKRCGLRYIYVRKCSSTPKMKLTATQQDGWPTINSRCKPVRELRSIAAPNLNIQIQRLLICDWLRPEPRLATLLLSSARNTCLSIDSLVPVITFRCHFSVAHSAYPSFRAGKHLVVKQQHWKYVSVYVFAVDVFSTQINLCARVWHCVCCTS